jgi:hypothetical protein
MKKKILISLTIQIVIIISAYLSASFVQWEFNPGTWEKNVRGAMITGILFASLFSHILQFMIASEKK